MRQNKPIIQRPVRVLHIVSSMNCGGIESWLMNKFDRVSTISDQMVLRLGAKGVPPARQVLFPNWADIDHIHPLDSPSTYREQLGIIASDIVFLYSGNMGEKQGLEIVVQAARQLAERKNIVFIMCGQGAAYSRLRELADGLTNIRWLLLQPLEKLNDLLKYNSNNWGKKLITFQIQDSKK